MEMSRVAVVVEDDHDIREGIRQVLLASGFTVYEAATGVEGVSKVRQHHPAIISLDLTLPDIDGFEVARQVRQFSDAYIVMVTARSEELDTLLGLESGADDYLTKPFRPRELRARIEALMRRSRERNPAETAALPGMANLQSRTVPGAGTGPIEGTPFLEPAVVAVQQTAVLVDHPAALVHNGLWLHPATRTVRAGGSEIELTRTEFDLLLALMRAGRVVRPKSELARGIRSGEYDTGVFVSEAEERVIEVHIGNLRRKLGDDPRLPRWVETVRGVGYRMAPSEAVVQDRPASR